MKYRKVDTIQVGSYGNPILRVYARGEDGKKYSFSKSGLPSYFFVDVEPSYGPDLAAKVKKIEPGYRSIFGKELWKVYTYAPGDTNKLREGYNHHEADIHWTDRACIDLKLTDGFEFIEGNFVPTTDVDHIPLRTWVLDVEISSPSSIIPSHEDPKWDTVCVVLWDNFDDKQYTWRLDEWDDEKHMWLDFLEFIREKDPDVITGWNIGFDVSWIIAKLSFCGIDPNKLSPANRAGMRFWKSPDGRTISKYEIAGRIVFDGLEAYKVKKNPSGQLSSYNLHAVAAFETEDNWDDLGPEIEYHWNRNPTEVVEYCQKDVEVETKIIIKERLIEQALTLCRLSGCTMVQTTSKEQIIDHALLLRRGDRILPSKRKGLQNRLDRESKVKGAVVLLPSPGIHDYIGVFDAAALYPSIMAGFNISIETKSENGTVHIEDEDGHVYKFVSRNERLGIMPEAIAEFRELRERVRERKRDAEEKFGHDSKEFKALEEEDTADKFIITSFYGVNGFAGFRLFDPECANAITAVGRAIINGLKEYLGARGYPVEYGDTDSVFVKMRKMEDGFEVRDLIADFLREKLTSMGVAGTDIVVKYEKYFDWCIFKRRKVGKNKWESVKKRYVAHMTYTEGSGGKMEPTSYMYVRGFETRRSDAPKILKGAMNKFFEFMKNRNYDKSIKILKRLKKQFPNMPPEVIAIPRKVDLTAEYKVKNPWIEGCKYGKEQLHWNYDEQTAPSLLYLKRVGPDMPSTNVICIQPDKILPATAEIDYNLMFDKVIRKKFEPLLDAMGLNWDKEIEGQTGMDAFF